MSRQDLYLGMIGVGCMIGVLLSAFGLNALVDAMLPGSARWLQLAASTVIAFGIGAMIARVAWFLTMRIIRRPRSK